MIRQVQGHLSYYQFSSLSAGNRVTHYVFARKGGFSRPPFASLNVGHTVGDDGNAVKANHGLVYCAANTSEEDVVTAHQVHGRGVGIVGMNHQRLYHETDALITNVPGLILMLRFADCTPVMLYDPVQEAVALIHSGRLGTLADIAGHTVHRMCKEYGSQPSQLMAGIGPSIGPCCYQVGPEVVADVRARLPEAGRLLVQQSDNSFHFDLWETIRRQLEAKGVQQIELAGLCTACHTDEFFSHRAERGHTGRFAALIGLSRNQAGDDERSSTRRRDN